MKKVRLRPNQYSKPELIKMLTMSTSKAIGTGKKTPSAAMTKSVIGFMLSDDKLPVGRASINNEPSKPARIINGKVNFMI